MARISSATLNPAPGSTRKRKRIGRGQGSGHGGTSTRGHKGAGVAVGTTYSPPFEGGQMPSGAPSSQARISQSIPGHGL